MAKNRRGSAPITFVVPGLLQAAGAVRGGSALLDPALAADPDADRIQASVRVGVLRSGGEPVRVQAVPGEHIVRIRIQDGPTLRLHPDTAAELLAGPGGAALRSSGSNMVSVGVELSWPGLEGDDGSATRGFLKKVLIAGLDILTGKKSFKDSAADATAEAVVGLVDGKVTPGVYRLSAGGELAPLGKSGQPLTKPIDPTPGGKPILVLLHGTFVDTASTFSKMWAKHPQAVQAMFSGYGDAVYALDHKTLGDSPFQNAQMLADKLPDGARVHLLTHSRGGLVGEVLARCAGQAKLDKADFAFFTNAHADQLVQLKALHTTLQNKKVIIERVVRVACPARGTLLASKRLDVYLSVLSWLLGKAGVVGEVASAVVDFLEAVAERRTDPGKIPGLEAMTPNSPLVRWLNQGQLRIPGELRVIAGDLKGESIGSWLKTLLSDAFYWTDNDIVVQTSSMYGGTPRMHGAHGGASFMLDQSGDASHFTYFVNRITVDAVLEGLMQSAPARYRTIGPLSWAGEVSDGIRGAKPATQGGGAPAPSNRPCLLMLPGILGSNLAVDGHRVWLGVRLLGGLDLLAYEPGEQTSVKPDGPISQVYDRLVEFLGKTHDVVEFAFDWRLPIEDEALRLAKEVEAQLDARKASNQPVRLYAHSMGGVVARTMQIVRPEVWQRLMAHPEARMLMLGTPNGGSWAPMQMLSGDDDFGNVIAAIGSPFANRDARRMIAAMPGLIQLQAGLTDPALALDKEETWARLAREDLALARERSWWHRTWLRDEGPEDPQLAVYEWGVPPQDVLNQAKALRVKLDDQRDRALAQWASKVVMVVGSAEFTPDGFEVKDGEFVYRNAVRGGDGRVPLSSARLPGVKAWSLDAVHGSLPSAKNHFVAFEELLTSGHTERLPMLADEDATRSGATAAGKASVRVVLSRPSRARRPAEPAGSEAEALALGAGRGVAAAPAAGTLQAAAAAAGALAVSVVNGNLSFIDVPLFIGHYRSLGLAGTERVVDRLIGNTMSTALDLNAGHYPEDIGSHQVFVNTLRDPGDPERQAKPPAAVVVGLGEEGKLNEKDLAATVRQAVLAWLQREHERGAAGAQAVSRVAIAATLIGSGGIGISPGLSARAIVRGVLDANKRMRESNSRREGGAWPVVERLKLIELYLDRAGEAWRELKVLAPDSSEPFVLASQIEFGTGPLRRPLEGGYRGAAYDFIRVTTLRDHAIGFALDSRRARAELHEQSTQVALVNEIVQNAAHDANRDEQLGRTLFHLLMPAQMEPYLDNGTRFVLELDAASAELPWELLDTRPELVRNDPYAETTEARRKPWALRTGLLRKLRMAGSIPASRRDSLADHDILIIGEPEVTKKGYAKLEAAVEEAKAVAAVFNRRLGRERPAAELRLHEKALPIINALYEREWRIVHVAGHGEAGVEGGVVLSGNAFLGPREIEAMRTVPELVFLNCCHAGRFDLGDKPDPEKDLLDPTTFAAGVAAKLIEIGVRCVVVAGWAVNDRPAQAFAVRLYESLLDRDTFGVAVGRAREAAHAFGGQTWAAYQCYGDPDWRLRSGTADAQQPPPPLDDEYDAIGSPVGLVLALEELAVHSKWEKRPVERQRSRIGWLEGRFGATMGTIGGVAEAFAVAYREAGVIDKAIEWYERAIAAPDSSASLKSEEQLLNLRARAAWHAVSAGKQKPEDARAALTKVIDELEQNSLRRPTDEQYSLLGSAWKRLALVERQAGRLAAEDKALAAAGVAYRKGYTIGARAGDYRRFYPGMNAWAMALVRGSSADGLSTEEMADVQAAQREHVDKAPDFWSHVGGIEFRMLDAIAGRCLAKTPSLADSFSELHRRHAAPRDWASVADQADLVLGRYAAACGNAAEAKAARELAALLRDCAGRTG